MLTQGHVCIKLTRVFGFAGPAYEVRVKDGLHPARSGLGKVVCCPLNAVAA